jgi:acyl CoA:acetate/3-ketoacid CoA transferase beta subunit
LFTSDARRRVCRRGDAVMGAFNSLVLNLQGQGLTLIELAPGVSLDQVRAATAAPFSEGLAS